MKKKFIPLCVFLTALSTFVQAQPPSAHTNFPLDSRLLDAFDKSYLDDLNSANPFLLQRLTFYLDNAWFITSLPTEKMSSDYPAIAVEDQEKINIFLLEKSQHLGKDWNRQMIYRLDRSDKVLVMRSGKDFTDLLNRHLQKG